MRREKRKNNIDEKGNHGQAHHFREECQDENTNNMQFDLNQVIGQILF